MLIAWTTVAAPEDADRIAREAVDGGLAACVQVAPVTSHYRWEGKIQKAQEFLLTFKLAESQLAPLEAHVLARHPYQTPEWIVARAEHVSEKYLSWAEASSRHPPF